RIVPGGADKSYGVHVAQLAGLPRSVTSRAWEVLRQLESDGRGARPRVRQETRKEAAVQIPLLGDASSLLLEELRRLDIPNMTPLEAISKLYELQQKAKESGA
ncbi:MAG: DNA mismatch repair protein MutS, partial [Chloroflexota bacterium]|nr:DNA mismatch repair protein MutS [Chloroflexota bacterium]